MDLRVMKEALNKTFHLVDLIATKAGIGLVLLALVSCKSQKPYLSVESTYVHSTITNEHKEYREVFLFSGYAFYHQDKVWACEYLGEKRNTKMWRTG